MLLGDASAASQLGDWLTETGLAPHLIRSVLPPAVRPNCQQPRDQIDLAILNSERRTIASSAS